MEPGGIITATSGIVTFYGDAQYLVKCRSCCYLY